MFENQEVEPGVILDSNPLIESSIENPADSAINEEYAQKKTPVDENQEIEGVQSRGQDSGVTDEKLFLESTGFGEPKRFTRDHEGDSELASLEPTNIDMASF